MVAGDSDCEMFQMRIVSSAPHVMNELLGKVTSSHSSGYVYNGNSKVTRIDYSM